MKMVVIFLLYQEQNSLQINYMGIHERQYVQRKFNPQVQHQKLKKSRKKLIIGWVGIILIITIILQLCL